MSDPIKDIDDLLDINGEREAAGLAPFDGIAEARQWKSEQGDTPRADDTTAVDKKEDDTPAADAADGSAQVKAEDAATVKTFAPPAPVRPEQKGESTEQQRIKELERQIQLLKTEDGRVKKLDSQLKEAESVIEQLKRRAEEAEQKAQEAADKAAGDELTALLTDEEREGLTPELTAVLQKVMKATIKKASAGASSEISTVRQELEARKQAEAERALAMQERRAAEMWDAVHKVVPGEVYATFGDNPKWVPWSHDVTFGQTNGQHYANAIASADHASVIRLFKDFMAYAGIEVPAKGQKPPMKISPSLASDRIDTSGKTEPQRYNADEVRKIELDFTKGRLPSGWTVDQFNAWSAKVDDARDKGLVVDRNGNPVYE